MINIRRWFYRDLQIFSIKVSLSTPFPFHTTFTFQWIIGIICLYLQFIWISYRYIICSLFHCSSLLSSLLWSTTLPKVAISVSDTSGTRIKMHRAHHMACPLNLIKFLRGTQWVHIWGHDRGQILNFFRV